MSLMSQYTLRITGALQNTWFAVIAFVIHLIVILNIVGPTLFIYVSDFPLLFAVEIFARV